jgi:hypothetical protein
MDIDACPYKLYFNCDFLISMNSCSGEIKILHNLDKIPHKILLSANT